MSKRTNNRTCFVAKKSTIMWKVQLVFIINSKFEIHDLLSPELEPVAGNILSIVKDSLVGIVIDTVSENETIRDVMNRFLENKLVQRTYLAIMIMTIYY